MIATLFKMSRPVNIAIAVATLFIGYFLLGGLPPAAKGVSLGSLILQSLGFASAIGFANIQNDILDLESDKLNRPQRPLVCEKISISVAKRSWIALAILTLACGIADGFLHKNGITAGVFFLLLTLLLIAYNKKLKHIPLLKNMTVAFLCATPLILCLFYPIGLFETEEITLELADKWGNLYPAMLFAFLLTTAREIYKDLEDETGDLKAGIMTFPLIAGAKTARRFAGLLCLFCWAMLPLPVVQGYYSNLFLILAALTLTPSLTAALLFAHKKNYRKAQRLLKIAMFLGLIALVASALI